MPFFGGLFGKKGKQQSTNVQYDDQISPQSTTPPPPFTPPPRRHKSPHSPLTRPSPSPNGLDGDDSSSNYPSSYPRRLERLPDNPSRSERRAAGNGLPSRPSLNVTTLHTPDRQSSGKPSPRGVQQRTTSPSLPHLASSDSLRPPPSRSAVFGGYAYSDSDDSDGLLRVTSSQSLPDAIPSHSGSPPKTPSGAITRSERGLTHQRARSSTEGSQNSFKSTRSKSKIFGWFKSSKSKSNSREGRNGGAEGSSENTSSSSQQSGSAIPPVPRTRLLASGGSLTGGVTSSSSTSNNDEDSDTFKVKGFRQVRPVSPGPSKPITTSSSHPLSTTTNLSPSRTSLDAALPPIGRPRGDSVGSESSQRVTVAAFRQAQARRSSVHMNGSPILGPAGDEPPLPNRTSFTLDADASSLMSAATSLWLGWDLGQQQQQQQQQPSSPVGPGLRLSTAGGGADNKSFVTFASNNGPRRSSFAQDDSKDGSPDHHHHHHHRSNNTSPTKNSGDNSLISNAKSSFSRSESNLGRQDTITAKNPGPLSKSAFYQKSRSQPSSPVVQSPPSPTRPMRSAARPPPSASVLLGASASAIAQPRQSSVSTVTSTGTVTVTGTGTGIKPFKASHSRGESGSTVTDRSTSHVGEQARASSSLASYGRSQGSKSTPILGASSPEGAGAGASGGRRQSGKGGKGKVTQPSSGAARRAVSMFADQSETSDEEESEADSDDDDEGKEGEEGDEDAPLSSLTGLKRPGTSMSTLSVSTSVTRLTASGVGSGGGGLAPSPSRKKGVAGSAGGAANRPPSSVLKPATRRSFSTPAGNHIPSSSKSDVGVSTSHSPGVVGRRPPLPNSGSPIAGVGGSQARMSSAMTTGNNNAGLSLGSKQPLAHQSQPSLPPSNSVPPTTSLGVGQQRPFSHAFRQSHFDSSPASSVGDSSSGKFPVTPRDGSEPSLGSGSAYASFGHGVAKGRTSNGATASGGGAVISRVSAMSNSGGNGGGIGNGGLPRPNHPKRRSVSFETPETDVKGSSIGSGGGNTSIAVKGGADLAKIEKAKDPEMQRMDRRRSEAKAAIELGNLVNGPPPIITDHDDAIANLGGGIGTPQQAWEAWTQAQARMSQALFMGPNTGVGNTGAGAFGPVAMPPTPTTMDPAYVAAHQQAMFIAKQTYQFAVAQQALAAANDEWERSSNATAAFGMQGSVMGTPSLMGGMGPMSMPMGMGMGMGMGMPMGMPMFPSSPASMYGGGTGRSVLGEPSNWGSASVYGGSFGPAAQSTGRTSGVAFPRQSGAGTGGNKSAASEAGGLPRPRQRTRTAPASQALPAARNGQSSRQAPSSWKMH